MPVRVECEAVAETGGGMAVLRAGLKQVTIYIPDEVYEALRGKAFVERTSINKLVTTAVETLLRDSPPPRMAHLTVPRSGRKRKHGRHERTSDRRNRERADRACVQKFARG